MKKLFVIAILFILVLIPFIIYSSEYELVNYFQNYDVQSDDITATTEGVYEITDLTATPVENQKGAVTLNWTAPYDPANSTWYDVEIKGTSGEFVSYNHTNETTFDIDNTDGWIKQVRITAHSAYNDPES